MTNLGQSDMSRPTPDEIETAIRVLGWMTLVLQEQDHEWAGAIQGAQALLMFMRGAGG